MTKVHEEYIRESIPNIKNINKNLKGELTVIISQKNEEKKIKKVISESVRIEIIEMMKKYSHKDVVEYIAKKENLSKKVIYNFCLKIKK